MCVRGAWQRELCSGGPISSTPVSAGCRISIDKQVTMEAEYSCSCLPPRGVGALQLQVWTPALTPVLHKDPSVQIWVEIVFS